MGTALPAVFAIALFLGSALTPCAPASTRPDSAQEAGAILILEFPGPLETGMPEKIRAAGAEPVCFLPPTSYLVRALDGRGPLVSKLDLVSIAPLLQGDRLSPELPAFLLDGGSTVTALFAGPRSDMERGVASAGARPLAWSPGRVKLEAGATQVLALSALEQVFWLEPCQKPVPVMDNEARKLGARQPTDGAFQNDGGSLWSYNNGAFEGTTGAGVNISITDSGIDGTHPAFDGRKVAFQPYGAATPWSDQGSGRGHGTMCAGIAAGDGRWRATDPAGTAGRYAGMAPGAGLVGQGNIYDYSAYYTIYSLCKTATTLGAYITSNSWGWGGYFGMYIDECHEYDTYVRDSDLEASGDQPLIVVFAAGNSGPTSMTVSPPGTAKNIITVGAIGNDKSGPYGYVTSDTIIGFSSRGPTQDNRIKPDLCAPGVDVYTTSAALNQYKNALGIVPDDTDASSYFVGGGTSAACPGVAGACALVVSYWKEKQGATPSPALTKALLINGAEPLPAYTYPGPDQGWGRMNVSRSVISKPDRNILALDQETPLRTGENISMLFNVSESSELKITIAWTDDPAFTGASRTLVSDLDLTVTDRFGNIYSGNNFVNGQSVPGGTADSINNVEGLLLKSPRPGRYWVNVTGKQVPNRPQDFALVMSGVFTRITADPAAASGTWGPAGPLEGNVIHMDFAVSNRGTGPARQFPYRITVDGQPIQTGILPDLGADESMMLGADWMALRGEHIFALDIDPQGLMDELSETNNHNQTFALVLHFGVSAAVSPDRVAVDPGGQAVYEMLVTATGTAKDTLQLSVSTPAPGWSCSLAQGSVALESGAAAKVALTVNCPALALACETAAVDFWAVSMGNMTYSAGDSVSAVARQIYEIGLPDPPPPAEALPGENALFNLKLRNGGNGDDLIGLVTDGQPEGWEVSLSNDVLLLPARSDSAFQARVRPPPVCLAGNSSTTGLTAYSQGNLSDRTSLTVIVKQFYGIELDFVILQEKGLPGATVEAIFFIRNAGNGPDEVRLQLASEPGWETRFQSSILIPGYETRPGNLTLTIPSGELTGDYPASFIARSAGGQMAYANFSIHVEQVFAVSASPSPRREVIFPGEAVELAISVTNLGNGNDSFRIEPEGLPDPVSVTSIGGPVPLNARNTAAATIKLATSRYTPPGEMALSFRAASRGSPVTLNYTSIIVVVLPVPAPPKARRDSMPFASDPTVGGSEPCGVVVILAAAVTAVVIVRSWRRRVLEDCRAQFLING